MSSVFIYSQWLAQVAIVTCLQPEVALKKKRYILLLILSFLPKVCGLIGEPLFGAKVTALFLLPQVRPLKL